MGRSHLKNRFRKDIVESTEVAKQEQEENARPELTASVENMADYDVIFLSVPMKAVEFLPQRAVLQKSARIQRF